MYNRSYAAQYQQTSVTSAVLDADPHRLIALMFSNTRNRLRLAQACMERGDMARKGQAIGDACQIIGGLDGALDHAAGGEIAAGLAALYEYAQRRLVEANATNDAAIMAEIDSLIGEIEGAWNAIAPGPAGSVRTEGAA